MQGVQNLFYKIKIRAERYTYKMIADTYTLTVHLHFKLYLYACIGM